MSDDIDRVQDAQAIHIAAALSRISPDMPAGVRGECDECGAEMPRLVGGRCGFCRDGRRPPLDRYPDLAPIAPEAPRLDVPMVVQAATTPAPGVPTAEEEDAMSISNCKVTIEGDAYDAIIRRAGEENVSYKQAATELIEIGAERIASPGATISPADITTVPVEDLIYEVRRRLDEAASDSVAAATARAEAAEAALASIRQTVLGIGPRS